LDERVNVVDLSCSRVAFSLLSLVKYIERARPASLLVTMPHISIVAVVAKWLAKTDFKLIIRQPNYLSLNTGSDSFLSYSLRKCICWFFAKAERIVAISNGVADDLSQYGINPSKITVIYNPIYDEQILQLAEDDPQHPWLSDQKRDYRVILAIGRLAKQKNFALLINAFGRISQDHDVRLIILGEGKLRDELQDQIKALGLEDKVDLAGYKKNPYAFLKRADVFVLSSSWEGFGNVLVEALALGKTVIATDCPSGPAEILQDGKYGTLVASGDVQALADSLIQAPLNQSDSAKQSAMQRAQQFAVASIAEQYRTVLLADS
jgi:glycosyltransferase involved in cell wall biosynthesis